MYGRAIHVTHLILFMKHKWHSTFTHIAGANKLSFTRSQPWDYKKGFTIYRVYVNCCVVILDALHILVPLCLFFARVSYYAHFDELMLRCHI